MATKKKSKKATKTTSKRQSSKKKLSLTREYMLALATQVYDNKTKKFMPLCAGKLCIKDKNKKFLHCIIGKIHHDIIVKQGRGKFTNNTETAIKDLCIHVKDLFLKEFVTIQNNVRRILKNASYGADDCFQFDDSSCNERSRNERALDIEDKFQELITINDDSGFDKKDQDSIFRVRAKNVSRSIREIAYYFPSEEFVIDKR